jgi:hypothetical protein
MRLRAANSTVKHGIKLLEVTELERRLTAVEENQRIRFIDYGL